MPQALIDPLARIHPKAAIGANVHIGPFAVIGEGVELGDNVRVGCHAVIRGRTRIGARTRSHAGAVIGGEPQDKKYAGEASALVIGPDCVIREHVTINTGTEGGGMVTRIGAGCHILAGAHVGHDCRMGDHVVIVNNVLLGGHAEIGDHAVLGGQSAIHQFVRIGAHAMIGGMSGVEHDVIPFGLVTGNRAALRGLNLVGLRRRGFPHDEIARLKGLYNLLVTPGRPFLERLTEAQAAFAGIGPAGTVLDFLRSSSRRSLTMPEHSETEVCP